MSAPEYAAWRTAVDRRESPEICVAQVEVTGLKRVNPEYVNAQLFKTKAGSVISTGNIPADTSRIYALADFEKVAYRIGEDPVAAAGRPAPGFVVEINST